MPDEQGNAKSDAEATPDTPLHAYRDGREEDVEGDLDKLSSTDPHTSQRSEIAEGDGVPRPPNPEKA